MSAPARGTSAHDGAAADGPAAGPVLRLGGSAGGAELVALRLRPRPLAVGAATAVTIAVLAAVALSIGDYVIPLPDVLATLAGGGTRAQEFVVLRLRLPRIVLAVAVGAALGASGAIFQSVARNALASPDLLGFSSGAATGAVLVILVTGGGTATIALGAVAGTLVTAVVVLGLVAGRGQAGYRLVLVGVGVNAMLVAANNFLLSRAELQSALAAQTWLVGTLNGASWSQVLPAVLVLVVALPFALSQARRADLLEMGDDAATGLGVSTRTARPVLVLTGVVLAGAATACAGPVAFVALAAPQVARRLTRGTGVGLLPAALGGALLLLAADVVAQRAFSPAQLPAGIVTGVLGGLYLVWLLSREWRSGR